MTETTKQPSAELNGMAIMTGIKEGFERFDPERHSPYTWMSRKTYYRLPSADTDDSRKSKGRANNKKVDIQFILDEPVCYAP